MKLLKYLTLALVGGILLYGTGAAADDDIFQTAFTVTANIFKNVRYIVYIIGGFGLIGLSVVAMLGKMNFKWLVYLAMGLALVAAADMIVTFATQTARNPNSMPMITYEQVDKALKDDSTAGSGLDQATVQEKLSAGTLTEDEYNAAMMEGLIPS